MKLIFNEQEFIKFLNNLMLIDKCMCRFCWSEDLGEGIAITNYKDLFSGYDYAAFRDRRKKTLETATLFFDASMHFYRRCEQVSIFIMADDSVILQWK